MATRISVNSKGRASRLSVMKSENDVSSVVYDFSLFFGSDTASSLTVTAESGLTVDSSALASNKATVVLSGGSAATSYDLTIQVSGTVETKVIVSRVDVVDMTYPMSGDYGEC